MAESEPAAIMTQGLDPKSGASHSASQSEADSPVHGTWGSKDGNISNSEWNDPEANKLPEKVEELEKKGEIPDTPKQERKKVVVVGLGMVGIAFM